MSTKYRNIERQMLERHNAKKAMAMPGYIQAEFARKWDAEVMKEAFRRNGMKVEIKEDPSGEGYIAIWDKLDG